MQAGKSKDLAGHLIVCQVCIIIRSLKKTGNEEQGTGLILGIKVMIRVRIKF